MEWVGWAVVVGIILLVTVVLVGFVHLEIEYSRYGEDDLFRLKLVALYGLFKHKFEVPVMRWDVWRKGVSIKEKEVDINASQVDMEGKLKIDRRYIVSSFEKLRELLTHTSDWYAWINATLARIRCTLLEWETRIGLGDAPDTAFTTGLIWSVKASCAGIILNRVRLLATPKLSVVPLFNEQYFSTSFRCKLKLRLGVALLAGFLLLVRILRVKGGLRVWRRMLTRA